MQNKKFLGCKLFPIEKILYAVAHFNRQYSWSYMRVSNVWPKVQGEKSNCTSLLHFSFVLGTLGTLSNNRDITVLHYVFRLFFLFFILSSLDMWKFFFSNQARNWIRVSIWFCASSNLWFTRVLSKSRRMIFVDFNFIIRELYLRVFVSFLKTNAMIAAVIILLKISLSFHILVQLSFKKINALTLNALDFSVIEIKLNSWTSHKNELQFFFFLKLCRFHKTYFVNSLIIYVYHWMSVVFKL